MYFNRDEKAKAAQNIFNILTETKGMWITPDLTFHETMFEMLEKVDASGIGAVLRKNIEARLRKVTETTGRSFQDNRFSSSEKAVQFYKDCGFFGSGFTYV
jgi:predicted nucleic acid-binding protein